MSRVTNLRSVTELMAKITYRPWEIYYQPTYSEAYGIVVKPDVTVNTAAADGYRRPSDYNVDAFRTPLVCEAGGTYATSFNYTEWSGGVAGELHLSSSHTPAAYYGSYKDALRMKVLGNLKDEILDVAMLIAEMQGTADTLVSGLHRIALSLDSFRKKKPESFRYLMHGQKPKLEGKRLDRFNRETASAYMEWKYGIMPTVKDVEGACKALDINEEGSLFDNPALMVARATLQGSDSVDANIQLQSPVWKTMIVPSVMEWSASARVDFTVNMEGIRGLSRYGLDLGTVATVMLERTPFMFVVNMAFPIMDLVKAWTALGGVNVRGYSETFFVQPKLQKTTWYPWGNPGLRLTSPADPVAPSFIRRTGTTVPMPLPFIRNPIKVGNLATVLALFTQMRKPA